MDTAQAACSAALLTDTDGRRRLWRRYEERDVGHAEALMPLVDEVLAEAGLGIGDLDALAVTVGPGTFSGVRIALSAARGMALGLDVPVVSVTTLEAIAAAVAESERAIRVACFDARRGEVYVQAFDAGLTPLAAPALRPLAEAAAALPGGELVLVGTGARLLNEALEARGRVGVLSAAPPYPDAAHVAEIALPRVRTAPTPPPEPLYIRAPHADLPPSVL